MSRSTGEKIATLASSYIGQHEVPAGSNWGPFVKKVLAYVGWKKPAPWCVAFAVWVVNRRHLRQPRRVFKVLRTASAYQLRQWAKTHDLWLSVERVRKDPTLLQVGYIFIVKGDKHAGIVEHQHLTPQRVGHISGNTSKTDGSNYNGGNVARHEDALSTFSGFVRTWRA